MPVKCDRGYRGPDRDRRDCLTCWPLRPPGGTTAAVEFTPDGKLKQPVGYRKWVYVGEVVTPNDLNDGEATFPEFHSVYMDPESFAEYEKTGKFRDVPS